MEVNQPAFGALSMAGPKDHTPAEVEADKVFAQHRESIPLPSPLSFRNRRSGKVLVHRRGLVDDRLLPQRHQANKEEALAETLLKQREETQKRREARALQKKLEAEKMQSDLFALFEDCKLVGSVVVTSGPPSTPAHAPDCAPPASLSRSRLLKARESANLIRRNEDIIENAADFMLLSSPFSSKIDDLLSTPPIRGAHSRTKASVI